MTKNNAPVTTEPATDSVRLPNNAFRAAYASVPAAEKTRAFTMLVCAGITLGVLLLSRLVWLFKPLFDMIFYGLLSVGIYYVLLFVICLVYCILLNRYVKKNCNERIFGKREAKMTIPQMLAIIAIGAAAVFVANAVFGFKTKIQLEMGGGGVTMASALSNVSVYVYYAVHLWLALTAAMLVQRSLTILLPSKHTIPWGAIFLVTVFGLIETTLEILTTPHLFPWMYYLFDYVYAAIFVLAEYRFHTTYWASIIIMVL